MWQVMVGWERSIDDVIEYNSIDLLVENTGLLQAMVVFEEQQQEEQEEEKQVMDID